MRCRGWSGTGCRANGASRSSIENRTGAAGNIGAEFVYRSAPDGYTLLSSPPPPLVINQNLYPKLGFDPAKFEPIVVMAHVPNALIVNPERLKASSVAELIDHMRRNPDTVTAATQGNGTTSHLTAELFQLMAKVKLRFIPYRGSAPALQGLLAGDADLMFDNLGVSLPLVEAGKLKLLAVASAERLPALPAVPALAEILPGFEAIAWYAIVAPPGTPHAIVAKINADVNEALRQPELQERLKKLSAEVFGGTPERTTTYMRGGGRPLGWSDQGRGRDLAVRSRTSRIVAATREPGGTHVLSRGGYCRALDRLGEPTDFEEVRRHWGMVQDAHAAHRLMEASDLGCRSRLRQVEWRLPDGCDADGGYSWR